MKIKKNNAKIQEIVQNSEKSLVWHSSKRNRLKNRQIDLVCDIAKQHVLDRKTYRVRVFTFGQF